MTNTRTNNDLAEKLDKITAKKLEHAQNREERWFAEPSTLDKIMNGIAKLKASFAQRKAKHRAKEQENQR